MTTEEALDFMPKLFGQPLYPAGLPLTADKIRYNDVTILEILFRNAEYKNEEDQPILMAYVLYHVSAPVFSSEFTDELIKQLPSCGSVDDMVSLCLDYGLDPF